MSMKGRSITQKVGVVKQEKKERKRGKKMWETMIPWRTEFSSAQLVTASPLTDIYTKFAIPYMDCLFLAHVYERRSKRFPFVYSISLKRLNKARDSRRLSAEGYY